MARISGTPWHTTTLGDGERHYRSVCKFYNKLTKYCSKQQGPCISPSRCRDFRRMSDSEIKERDKGLKEAGYQSKPRREKHKEDFWFLHDKKVATPVSKKDTVIVKKNNKAKEVLPSWYKVGARVYTDTYKTGRIIAIDNNSIFIEFENGTTKWFVYPQCRDAVKVLDKEK